MLFSLEFPQFYPQPPDFYIKYLYFKKKISKNLLIAYPDDDNDVVKPDGYKFESLGIVRDGFESTSTKNVYKKGYHVTEASVLTSSNHPVSFFQKYILHTRKIISLQIPLLFRS